MAGEHRAIWEFLSTIEGHGPLPMPAPGTHLPPPENHSSGKTRVAFYVVAGGHTATLAVANSMPRNIYDPLICSLLHNEERTVRELNHFQPHRLVGYSSSLASLAELALSGSLRIRPQRIFVSGDYLTPSMEEKSAPPGARGFTTSIPRRNPNSSRSKHPSARRCRPGRPQHRRGARRTGSTGGPWQGRPGRAHESLQLYAADAAL